MCNDFGNHNPYSDYLAAFSETRIPVRLADIGAEPRAARRHLPTDKAPVIRRMKDGTNQF